MLSIKEDVFKLNLDYKLINKLKDSNLLYIEDIWILKRKDLKEKGFSDSEIKSIIVSLQLEGLDLNRKMYDK